jgi:cytidylate kinase
MKKAVIVINGAGGVGKDTLCDMAAKHFKVYNISSITPIKEVAKSFGWSGEKTDKARKFLADLKALAVEYNDYPTLWAKARYSEFLASDNEVMFVHIRECDEIRKFVNVTCGAAKTLLIRGGRRMKKTHYGNSADDMVENYNYDYYFVNENSFAEAERDFVILLEKILKEN